MLMERQRVRYKYFCENCGEFKGSVGIYVKIPCPKCGSGNTKVIQIKIDNRIAEPVPNQEVSLP